MTTIQRLREQLETALTKATTRREEREIGRALIELAEQADFREHTVLSTPDESVQLPSDFSLPSPLTERSAVPPHPTGR